MIPCQSGNMESANLEWKGANLDWFPDSTQILFRTACQFINIIFVYRTDRDLTQRIEFLSRAKINAKSVTSATADSNQSGQLLNELEEKLEVCDTVYSNLIVLKL